MILETKKSTDTWFPVSLLDLTDMKTPVTGKIYSDVSILYAKSGSNAFSTAVVDSSDWLEPSASGGLPGFYWLRLGGTEFTSPGLYEILVKCTNCISYHLLADVRQNLSSDELRNIRGLVSAGRGNGLVRYVYQHAETGGDGLSWDTAYKTIQPACADLTGKGGIIFLKSSEYFEDVIVPPQTSVIGVYTEDLFPEIRGKSSGSTGPTLTLMEGAEAINLRIGKVNNASFAPVRLLHGAALRNCSTGGIDVASPSVIQLGNGSVGAVGAVIDNCSISGSNHALSGISGWGDTFGISNNTFCQLISDHVSVTGMFGTFLNNKFLAVASGKYAIKIPEKMGYVLTKNHWNGTGSFLSEQSTSGSIPNLSQNNGTVWDDDLSLYSSDELNAAGRQLADVRRALLNKMAVDNTTSKLKIYDDAGNNVLFEASLTDILGNSIQVTGRGPAGRGTASIV